MKRSIAIFLTLLLFFTSFIPFLQTPLTPQKAYAETCVYYMKEDLDNVRFLKTNTAANVRSYTYDPFGNVTTQFVNDVSGDLTRVLVAKNTTTNTSNYFVQGPSAISEGDASVTSRKYYLYDGMGNIRFITDSSGNKLQVLSYDPYGNPLAANGANVFQYKGEQMDQAGMYFMRARYYDPATGRFISKDPVEGAILLPQSQNGYSYAGNNSINMSDPSGLNYVNWNFSSGQSGLGASCGLLFSEGKIYPYLGGGVMFPGVSTSLTGSTANPVPNIWSGSVNGSTGNAIGAINYSPGDSVPTTEAGIVMGTGAKTQFSGTIVYTFDDLGTILNKIKDTIIPQVY